MSDSHGVLFADNARSTNVPQIAVPASRSRCNLSVCCPSEISRSSFAESPLRRIEEECFEKNSASDQLQARRVAAEIRLSYDLNREGKLALFEVRRQQIEWGNHTHQQPA